MKSIILTGCNKGIGFGILEKLSSKPYKIIMACRNLQLAEEARQKVITPENENRIHVM
jgi:carbonyl reductase 1/carbonyl reductase 3